MEKLNAPPPNSIDAAKKYSVTVHTSRGDFVIDLVDPKVAPQTVNNFVYLAQNHYYDGLTFHRVVAGFVVQGGDPLGNGTGGPDYKLPDESNASRWPRGTVGMAKRLAGRRRLQQLLQRQGRHVSGRVEELRPEGRDGRRGEGGRERGGAVHGLADRQPPVRLEPLRRPHPVHLPDRRGAGDP